MRKENRAENALRQVEIVPNINPYAEGSCLIKCGNTHIYCTATVDDKLPAWLKGQDRGWITAEYALLPRSTQTRVSREINGHSGRTHEIQRLIGRSLRAVTDLYLLKDHLVQIDCDALQADGGTRTVLWRCIWPWKNWWRKAKLKKTRFVNLWRLFLADCKAMFRCLIWIITRIQTPALMLILF